MSKEGFENLNRTLGVVSKDNLPLDVFSQTANISAGRVVSVILDESHPRYPELGGAKAIGAVELVDIQGSSRDYSTINKQQNKKVAFPLQPGFKNYPLINEIVYYTEGQPSKEISNKTTSTNLYYISIINLWNHPHHNAIPYSAGSKTEQNQSSYQDVSRGVSNKTNNNPGEITLGKYFKERQDVNPLKPFEGDVLLEGRFGNSIRLAGTGGTNPWSSVGEQGSPIVILRNGQGSSYPDVWTLITEDINTDASSIYLTTTQKIPLTPSSINSYSSYKQNKPEGISDYTKPQLILNAGRLVLNTTQDHLLLASTKSINLNAKEGINFDTTKNVELQAGRVNLGSSSAEESVLLGDTLITQLETIVDVLTKLLFAASVASNSGGPVTPLITDAPKLLTQLGALNLQLAKSKRVYTV
jgi:hypothetical protein